MSYLPSARLPEYVATRRRFARTPEVPESMRGVPPLRSLVTNCVVFGLLAFLGDRLNRRLGLWGRTGGDDVKAAGGSGREAAPAGGAVAGGERAKGKAKTKGRAAEEGGKKVK